MRGNTFGRFLTITTFGESHGVALGTVIDGCPSGITLSQEDFEKALSRRRPGQSSITTARQEADKPEILSGIFEGKTLGTPIAVIVRNQDQRSSDYSPDMIRQGHADEVWQEKFGHRDWRGGGRSSGRETLCRVIGGVVASKILPQNVSIVGFTRSIGTHVAQKIPKMLTIKEVDRHPTRCPDHEVAEKISKELLACKTSGDSRGGIIEIWMNGIPIGWGEPVFHKLKSGLTSSLMGVGAVCGVEIGDGFSATSQNGNLFHSTKEGAGGIQGGISNGERIVAKVAFKPASTLGMNAKKGRHDPCIVPRAVPVLEAMAALVLADLYLATRLDRMDR